MASNFLIVLDVSLEMQSDSKNYVKVQDDKITELVHSVFPENIHAHPKEG